MRPYVYLDCELHKVSFKRSDKPVDVLQYFRDEFRNKTANDVNIIYYQGAAADCGKVALDAGMKRADVFVKGPGSGREGAIRSLSQIGFEITSIKDITPLPHNGCRPPKKRRV